MDFNSGKRAGGWNAALRKGSSPATRDIAGSGNDDAQFCKRIGCSGRLKHTRNEFLGRPKALSPSSDSLVTHVKKPFEVSRKKLCSKTKTSSSNSSSVSDESEIQELNTSAHAKLKLKSRDTESNKGISRAVSRKVEVASSNTKTRKVYGKKDAQKPQIGSFDSGRRRNAVEKGSTRGETSTPARAKKIIGSSSDEVHVTNCTPCRGSGVSSVRTRRSINLHGNNPSRVQSTRVTLDMQQTESCLLSSETSSTGSTSNGGCLSSDASSSMIPVASHDQFISRFDRHRSGQYNVDTIANVLLALERIDHDEGLTYEQILSLEVNSVLGGFNIYDHHRDMRLDIDNMSYEELLALEEKMGIVSTALSEEELLKCLRISVYQPLRMKEVRMSGNWCLDDTKCSICQEEFIAGDEIGTLGCDHGYHAVCINQWLRLKNWCPICKASAKPSHSS